MIICELVITSGFETVNMYRLFYQMGLEAITGFEPIPWRGVMKLRETQRASTCSENQDLGAGYGHLTEL